MGKFLKFFEKFHPHVRMFFFLSLIFQFSVDFTMKFSSHLDVKMLMEKNWRMNTWGHAVHDVRTLRQTDRLITVRVPKLIKRAMSRVSCRAKNWKYHPQWRWKQVFQPISISHFDLNTGNKCCCPPQTEDVAIQNLNTQINYIIYLIFQSNYELWNHNNSCLYLCKSMINTSCYLLNSTQLEKNHI